jgi:hypothetical protein
MSVYTIMTSFDENKFVEDFLTYYNQQNENYDISLVFDNFFEITIIQEEKLEEVFNHYFPNEPECDEDMIFDKLFEITQSAIVDTCESEADTDREDDD